MLLWLHGNTEGASEVGDTTNLHHVDSPVPSTSKRESIAKTISTVELWLESCEKNMVIQYFLLSMSTAGLTINCVK